ncbi:hypothetical protein BJV82DRAFT_667073 [Fennellomyces sp. T-0311]|nr:hypothetical protein BJV82DRAFT_667073 [Fennellomyces sp. T-0311]
MPISDIDKALDSKDLSVRQLSFMNVLHCDITIEIFSLLTQQDCLMCMSVCRDWYYAIPQYTQSAWKVLRLRQQDASKDHHRRERCLGSHVKRVVLQSVEDVDEERPSSILMQRLVDWGCTKIESLEFMTCSTTDLNTFFDFLRRLAPYLTHLKLEQHTSTVPIVHVFSTCSQLTHLTYQPMSEYFPLSWPQHIIIPLQSDGQSIVPSSGVPVDCCSKITYLRLDVVLKKQEMEYILKRCPELQCFIGVSSDTASGYYNSRLPDRDYMDINSLVSWCPKINTLVSNFSYYKFDDIKDLSSYTSNLPGLRRYHPSRLESIHQIAPYLAAVQDTLEVLAISRYSSVDDDWSPVFDSLRMPNLRALICSETTFRTVSSLVTMLNSSPLLQKLDLCCSNFTVDLTLARSFHNMHMVRYLRIRRIKFQDGPSMATFFDRFSALETLETFAVVLPLELPDNFRCPRRLKSLTMIANRWDHMGFVRDIDTDQTIADFLEHLFRNSRLETIKLTAMRMIKRQGVQATSTVRTLKNLTVCLTYLRLPSCERSPTIQSRRDAGFFEFAKMLSRTKIEKLLFEDCCQLPPAVLGALAELPLLEKFKVTYCIVHEWTSMRGGDLVHLLYKSRSLVTVFFKVAKILGEHASGLDCEQLSALIEDQRSAYNKTRTGRWKATATRYNGLHQTLDDLSIEWLDD